MSEDRRFEDPLERMARERAEQEEEQPEEAQEAAQKQAQRGSRRRQQPEKKEARFADPLEGKSKEAIMASYTESARAGNYIRHSFTWKPGQLAKIKEIARELNLSMNATARWLLDLGLIAYLEQGVEPELQVKEVRAEPKLREW